jgi:hypothetical protein
MCDVRLRRRGGHTRAAVLLMSRVGARPGKRRVLNPCGLIYTVRTGTSRQGRPIAKNGRDGIGVRSPRRAYATAGAGGWFVPEETRIDSRAGAAAESGERDELAHSPLPFGDTLAGPPGADPPVSG